MANLEEQIVSWLENERQATLRFVAQFGVSSGAARRGADRKGGREWRTHESYRSVTFGARLASSSEDSHMVAYTMSHETM